MNQLSLEKKFPLTEKNCTHPFTVVCSVDTTLDEWDRKPNHLCPICGKTFFNYYDELEKLYNNKKLIGQKTEGIDGKTFTIVDCPDDIINIYLKINKIMEKMQGPCLPNAEEVLFDYISLKQKQKYFTKIYKNNVK